MTKTNQNNQSFAEILSLPDFPERQAEIRSLQIGLLSGESVLFIGSPGTAKSLIVEAFASGTGLSYFRWLLTKFTTPEEIFGALDLQALEQGHFQRNIAGKLPDCEIGFVDEVFKASSSILNSLLTIMQERLFFNNGTPANPIAGYIVLWKPAKVKLGDPLSPKFMTKHTQTSIDKCIDHAVRHYNTHSKEHEAKVVKDNHIYIRNFKVSQKQSSTELDIKNAALAVYDGTEDRIKSFSGDFQDLTYLAGQYDERRNYVLSYEVSSDLQNYIEQVLCGVQLEVQKATYFVANCFETQLMAIEEEMKKIGGRLKIYEYLFSTNRSKSNLQESILEDIKSNLSNMKAGLKLLKEKRESDGYPGGSITDLVVNYKKLQIYYELMGDINQDILDNILEFENMMQDMFSIPKGKKEDKYLSETINRKVDKLEEKKNLY